MPASATDRRYRPPSPRCWRFRNRQCRWCCGIWQRRDTDQRIIGRTLQTLYDDAIISGPSLTGGLANTSQALKVKLVALELEDRARVWHAIQRPYRISLVYEVRFVNLDPTAMELRPPVRVRQLDPAVPVEAA